MGEHGIENSSKFAKIENNAELLVKKTEFDWELTETNTTRQCSWHNNWKIVVQTLLLVMLMKKLPLVL